MDFYEDERDVEIEKEKNCVKLRLECGLILSLPEETIEDRMEALHSTREETIEDAKFFADAFTKDFSIDEIHKPDFCKKILDFLNNEIDTYRVI